MAFFKVQKAFFIHMQTLPLADLTDMNKLRLLKTIKSSLHNKGLSSVECLLFIIVLSFWSHNHCAVTDYHTAGRPTVCRIN